ncbi:hypothetical protein [Geomicrobium sp. JCM 19038]|uniref:hypothetical protein n=1 Tax=Geomicrobium sp. JCM 19038 TaxID=1460635 RepID=UPI00045F12D7|nr:hypothetical protein [Geomicrobium sp. JCM 19038]GAK09020.1 hypothetical protein JCM19038_2831 [Geomicrobium sp. JCM 19038]
MNEQLKYLSQYVLGLAGALFLVLDAQFGIVIDEGWLDVLAQTLAIVFVVYTIYSNKYTTPKAKRQAKTLEVHEEEWK